MDNGQLTKQELETMATDAFLQAQDGYEVELDPELADYMGAFEQEGVTIEEIREDWAARAAQGYEDGQ